MTSEWVAGQEGARKTDGQDIHTQQHRHRVTVQNRTATWAHTEEEMASYLDEVWKMARL